MDILKKIVIHKKQELIERKKNFPLESFKSLLTKSNKDFKQAISRQSVLPNLIAEVKKASPSEGLIRQDFDPIAIAKIYNEYAAAISVLTDEHFFGGKIDYLRDVAKVATIPLLRKDFIIDEYQIYEARHFGADAVLLIAAILSSSELAHFSSLAESYGMNCLVEVHSQEELERVLELDLKVIGINNRDLKTFTIDLDTSIRLSEYCKNKLSDLVLVAESGINSHDDLLRLQDHVSAVLIGTSFMKSQDIQAKICSLFKI